MVDDLLYAQDRTKPISQNWRKGPKITLKDMKNGTGFVQKISHAEALGLKESAKSDEIVFDFGKYRGRLVSEIKQQDPSYYAWVMENVPRFAKTQK